MGQFVSHSQRSLLVLSSMLAEGYVGVSLCIPAQGCNELVLECLKL